MLSRLLIVDDEEAMWQHCCAVLSGICAVEVAATADEGLRRVREALPFAVVIADMHLPDQTGAQFLAEVEKLCPATTRVMQTGDSKQETAVEAVNLSHVFRFISKPCPAGELRAAVEESLRHHQLVVAEHELLETTLRSSINLVLEVLAAVDPHSFAVSQGVRRAVRQFAQAARFPRVWELEMAAALARIGTASLPAVVMGKLVAGSPLLRDEQTLVDHVPEVGAQLLKTVPRMEPVATAVRYQLKNFDGSGPPADTCAGDQIPVAARILRIFTDRGRLELDGLGGLPAWQAMGGRRGCYDPALLAASFEQVPGCFLRGLSPQMITRRVQAAGLWPNQTVVEDIVTKDGILLVSAGSRLTSLMIKYILNHLNLRTIQPPFLVQDLPPESAGAVTQPPFSRPGSRASAGG
jgi:response regulator RpfG family c-di-GMP phosphodiesterase